jgi:hypothetical protein
VAHRLRSALKAMLSPFSASFHSGQSAKCLAGLPLLLSWFGGSFAGSFFTLITLGVPSSQRDAALAVRAAPLSVSSWLALRGAVLRLAASSLILSFSPIRLLRSLTAHCSQSRGILSSGFVEWFVCRSHTEVAMAESSFLSSSCTVPCSRAMPNPSINRTCPGKPGHAGYLKR